MDLVSVYKKNCDALKIKKANVKLQKEDKLPCVCIVGELIGIAEEYIKDEDVYIVDIAKNKIFAGRMVKLAELPTKQGEKLYIDGEGFFTGKKDTNNKEVGIFLGVENETVLFKLD